MMEQLSYIIADKTIAEILGRQNFSSDESAILELVKNAYDASAQKIILNFKTDEIIIDDDGIGMDAEDIKKYWMHIGESQKGYEIVQNGNIRVLAGSKGVGRFALARLGSYVEVLSRKENNEGICWKTGWNGSVLENTEKEKVGTQITIKQLMENWTTKKIENLIDFLSKTYCETTMKIVINYSDKAHVYQKEVLPFLKPPKLGVNCTSSINFIYYAKELKLSIKIQSDEFLPEAQKYVTDANINSCDYELNMFEELKNVSEIDLSEIELKKALETLGNFNAELLFFIKPTKRDKEKFLYKYSDIIDGFSNGIILYRNAFSISSYEGKKDWLELGKRARKSPASPSHETGAWRVRDNQLTGKVTIDKKKNEVLEDMSNRQGLVENIYYQLFINIIHSGLKLFERYRQGIVRAINKKNKIVPVDVKMPMTDKIINNPKSIEHMDQEEQKQLRQELLDIKKAEKEGIKEKEEVEKRYKYDVRILNVLATSGLKASSISHDMNNDRNDFAESVDNIIVALKEYGMWDELCSSERTKKEYKNVPSQLETNKRVGKKILSFMDVMLTEIEKQQFEPTKFNIHECIQAIKKKWERDYAWIAIENLV